MVNLTKMDRERADFDRALEGLQKRFGRGVVPVQIPIGQEAGFTGVVDLVDHEGLPASPATATARPSPPTSPPSSRTRSRPARAQLVEAVAETDDQLMEGFFENGTLAAGGSGRRRCAAPSPAGRSSR